MCERPPRAAGPRPSGGPRRERGWRSGPRGSRQPGPHPPSAQLDRDAGAVRAGRRRDGGRWWPATHARPGTRGPGYRACRWRARRSGSWPRPPAGQRALGLQGSDLGFQQLALKQHLAQLRLQALGLQRLASGGPCGETGLTGRHEGVPPSRQGRGGDAQRPREYLQVFTPQQAQHRIALALARHAPTPAQADLTRSCCLCRHRHPPADHVRFKGCLSQSESAARVILKLIELHDVVSSEETHAVESRPPSSNENSPATELGLEPGMVVELRRKLDTSETVEAVIALMRSAETQQSLAGLTPEWRDEVRAYAKSRMVA